MDWRRIPFIRSKVYPVTRTRRMDGLVKNGSTRLSVARLIAVLLVLEGCQRTSDQPQYRGYFAGKPLYISDDLLVSPIVYQGQSPWEPDTDKGNLNRAIEGFNFSLNRKTLRLLPNALRDASVSSQDVLLVDVGTLGRPTTSAELKNTIDSYLSHALINNNFEKSINGLRLYRLKGRGDGRNYHDDYLLHDESNSYIICKFYKWSNDPGTLRSYDALSCTMTMLLNSVKGYAEVDIKISQIKHWTVIRSAIIEYIENMLRTKDALKASQHYHARKLAISSGSLK